MYTLAQALVAVVKRDADERTVGFSGRPHLRLLVGILCELPGAPGAGPAPPMDPAAEGVALRWVAQLWLWEGRLSELCLLMHVPAAC